MTRSNPGERPRDPQQVVREINDAVQAIREAFRPLANLVYRVWVELQPVLEKLAEAAERGELTIEPAPPERSCHCLCGIHKADGMFCAAAADTVIPLTGPSGVASVPMCEPCARWWLRRRAAEAAGAR